MTCVRWLIDGYNVIRRSPELGARERESLEAGRRALCELLEPGRAGPPRSSSPWSSTGPVEAGPPAWQGCASSFPARGRPPTGCSLAWRPRRAAPWSRATARCFAPRLASRRRRPSPRRRFSRGSRRWAQRGDEADRRGTRMRTVTSPKPASQAQEGQSAPAREESPRPPRSRCSAALKGSVGSPRESRSGDPAQAAWSLARANRREPGRPTPSRLAGAADQVLATLQVAVSRRRCRDPPWSPRSPGRDPG